MNGISVFLWASFAVGAVLSVITQVHSEVESSAIPVALNRRSIDVRILLQEDNTVTGSTNIICDDDNATYLVEENQCINNQHLFNGNEKCMTLYYSTLFGIIINFQHRMLFFNYSKCRTKHFKIDPGH